ncbi:hypothetical protein IE53DRAFT_127606 [Violaceomyces palustris]|uniref:Uncharacterized protein n=1 Tax=Violaceomyces palustris TaxID=1673888 RepID=A0ACD0NVP1_9BASI|nr:hypothetical protein IE53DRAFT_127606 [Violaceomyces palustris]
MSVENESGMNDHKQSGEPELKRNRKGPLTRPPPHSDCLSFIDPHATIPLSHPETQCDPKKKEAGSHTLFNSSSHPHPSPAGSAWFPRSSLFFLGPQAEEGEKIKEGREMNLLVRSPRRMFGCLRGGREGRWNRAWTALCSLSIQSQARKKKKKVWSYNAHPTSLQLSSFIFLPPHSPVTRFSSPLPFHSSLSHLKAWIATNARSSYFRRLNKKRLDT